MSLFSYLILIAIVTIAGAVVTILIGLSKQTREGNPDYDRRSKGNMSRLTLIYAVAALLGLVALFAFTNW
jgi:hypothetical protein